MKYICVNKKGVYRLMEFTYNGDLLCSMCLHEVLSSHRLTASGVRPVSGGGDVFGATGSVDFGSYLMTVGNASVVRKSSNDSPNAALPVSS